MARPRVLPSAEFIGSYPTDLLGLTNDKRRRWGWQRVSMNQKDPDKVEQEEVIKCILWHLLKTNCYECGAEHIWQAVTNAYRLDVTTNPDRVAKICDEFRQSWQYLVETLTSIDNDERTPS